MKIIIVGVGKVGFAIAEQMAGDQRIDEIRPVRSRQGETGDRQETTEPGDAEIHDDGADGTRTRNFSTSRAGPYSSFT